MQRTTLPDRLIVDTFRTWGSHPIFEALIPGLIVLVVAPLSAHNARTPLAATKAEIEWKSKVINVMVENMANCNKN